MGFGLNHGEKILFFFRGFLAGIGNLGKGGNAKEAVLDVFAINKTLQTFHDGDINGIFNNIRGNTDKKSFKGFGDKTFQVHILGFQGGFKNVLVVVASVIAGRIIGKNRSDGATNKKAKDGQKEEEFFKEEEPTHGFSLTRIGFSCKI